MVADPVFVFDGVVKNTETTFFPDEWSEDKVLEGINRAYQQIVANKLGTFVKYSQNSYRYIVDGVEIEIFLDATNKIISAFPAKTLVNFHIL